MKPEFGEADKPRLAWEALELPPPAVAPPGFAAAVAARARAERNLLPGFALSPAWAGVAALLLVVTGAVGGAEMGFGQNPAEDPVELESSLDESAFWADDGLLDGSLFDPDAESGAAEAGAEVGL